MKIGLLFFCCIFCAQAQAQGQKKSLPQLNSKARETNLSISPNGKFLYFMSDQGGQPWTPLTPREVDKSGVKHYDGDIWYSVNLDGKWQAPVCLDNSINTSEGEDEPNITADGQRVYFQSWRDDWENTGGPYYMAALNGTVWGTPVGLGGEITRFFKDLSTRTQIDLVKRLKKEKKYEYYLQLQAENQEAWQDSLRKKGFATPNFWIATDGMAISPNENIYIVSAYIPEKGNYDLLISRKNDDGVWSYPKPLNINSDGEEKSVFIAADNQTVYFASNKAGGLGGLDIYKTSLTGGTNCSPPANLGSVFNTPKDDNGLILDATGKAGFMTSDGDIFQAILEIDAPKAIVINGIVIDQNNNPLAANIELFQGTLKKPSSKSSSNAHTGAFSFSLKREEGMYRQHISTLDGQSVDTLFEVKTVTPEVLNFVIIVNVPVKSKPQVVSSLEKTVLRTGEIFQIDQLQFDVNSAVIKQQHYPLLNQIAEILKSKEKLMVEIGGHTNGLVEQAFGDKLSQDRALAVYNYLLGQKVPMKNMSYKGYGKRVPIASNDNKYERQLNQRVEIKILKTE